MRTIINYIFFISTLVLTGCDLHEAEIPSYIEVNREVRIVYDGESAMVYVPEAFTDSVSYTINGAFVSLTSACLQNELFYHVSGSSSNGMLRITGNYKFTMMLAGLDLTNTRGGAIDLQCGKRLNVILAEGTTNKLTDYEWGGQRACFYARGHVEFSGGGELNIVGNGGHAFSCKEYLEIKPSTGKIVIEKSKRDGLHCGEYFLMRGGHIVVRNAGTDCIDSDDFGNMIISGGQLDLEVSAVDAKGLKCDSMMTITGGIINMTVPSNGSKGINVGQNLQIGVEGTKVNTRTPQITIVASGDVYDPTGGNAKCMGIRVLGNMSVYNGDIQITSTGDKSEGIKVHGTYYQSEIAIVNASIDKGV